MFLLTAVAQATGQDEVIRMKAEANRQEMMGQLQQTAMMLDEQIAAEREKFGDTPTEEQEQHADRPRTADDVRRTDGDDEAATDHLDDPDPALQSEVLGLHGLVIGGGVVGHPDSLPDREAEPPNLDPGVTRRRDPLP